MEKGYNGHPGPYAHGKTGTELYDLEKDIGEKNNVASQFPEIVKRLKKMGEKAREKLGDMRKKGKGVRPPGRIMD